MCNYQGFVYNLYQYTDSMSGHASQIFESVETLLNNVFNLYYIHVLLFHCIQI